MKRIVGLMLIIISISLNVRACDVCGCSASNQYLGILPQYKLNFIGIQYQYSSFSSNVPSDFIEGTFNHSKEYYNTLQLWGRYNIARGWQVYAFVPYHYNLHYEDSAATSSGIGDVSFLVNKIVLNTDKPGKWSSTWLAGGGVKLPTGKYTGITTLDKLGLPNIQAGTGSWDFVINTNYTLRHNKVGFNVDAAYTITTANKYEYKYGNRLNTGLMAFYSVKLKKVNLLPQLGVRYDYSLHDYDNYQNKWLNEQSGGSLCYATAGVQAYIGRLGMRLTYGLPVVQNYGAGYVTAKQQIDAGIFFLF